MCKIVLREGQGGKGVKTELKYEKARKQEHENTNIVSVDGPNEIRDGIFLNQG